MFSLRRSRRLAALGVAACLASLAGCGYAVLGGFGIVTALTTTKGGGVAVPRPVSVTTPGLVNDRVAIEYLLSDPTIRSFDTRVEYSTRGTAGPFREASEALGYPSQGTRNLSASTAGNPHVFVWNSYYDLEDAGLTTCTDVVVRVTAMRPTSAAVTSAAAPAFGEPGETRPFTVDNRLIATVAGLPATSGEGLPSLTVPLLAPTEAVVESGSLYVADTGNGRIRVIDRATKLATTVAGSTPGYGGDGGPATAASLLEPSDVDQDRDGNLVIADTGNNRIRRVDARTGIIQTIAGIGSAGYSGDGGPAASAALSLPSSLDVTATNDIVFCDAGNHAVRMISPSGTITTIAGTGAPGTGGDGGRATGAQLNAPSDIDIDATGAILVADSGNHAVRRFVVGGSLTTIAGTLGTAGRGAEDVPATASALDGPRGITSSGGTYYVSDSGNNRIRAFKAGSTVKTVAGSLDGRGGYAGDNGPAVGALLNNPAAVEWDGEGGLLVADAGNNRIRGVSAEGEITTLVGSGSPDARNVGDGDKALRARVAEPVYVAVGADGSVYFADKLAHRVRRFSVGKAVTAVAGDGAPGYVGDGGTASAAKLNTPRVVSVDQNGIAFILDHANGVLRAVSPTTGAIRTVAGGGSGPDGVATLTSLRDVRSMCALAGKNELLLAERGGADIRRLTYTVDSTLSVTSGVIDTVCGTPGTSGFANGTSPTNARISRPTGIDADATGQVYFVDQNGSCVRTFRIGQASGLRTVAGTPGTAGYSGDGGPATSALVNARTLAVDRTRGFIYTAEQGNRVVRRFTDGGTISTFAGNGEVGDPLDGPQATATYLPGSSGIAVDPTDGSVFVCSLATRRIYRITLAGAISAVAGLPVTANAGDGDAATNAIVSMPVPAVYRDGTLYVAERTLGRIRRVDARTGVISTFIGKGVLGSKGNNGPIGDAYVEEIYDMATGPDGDVYLAEGEAHLVREIQPDHDRIKIVGGGGTGGDGGPATSAVLGEPWGVAFSPKTGATYLADEADNRVRRIDSASGVITTVAGGGSSLAENVLATSASLVVPVGVAVDANENVYVSQQTPVHLVRRFTVGGTIVTVAGVRDQGGFNGDGIPATTALLRNPQGVAVDAAGLLYVCDSENNRVRRLDAAGFIATVAGTGEAATGPDGVPAQISRVYGPNRITIDRYGAVYVGEMSANRVRRFRPFP